MSAQKKRWERQKRIDYYYRKKNADTADSPHTPPKKSNRIRLASLLKGVVHSLRSRLALFKLAFAKKLLAREQPRDNFNSRYQRQARTSLVVEHFYEKNAIHYPGQKTPQSKVLSLW